MSHTVAHPPRLSELASSSADVEEIVIEADHAATNYWRDLWRFRELTYFLVWRDVIVRYKQTVIGIAWVVLQPLLMMIVFTVIFGRIAKLPSNGIPYPILVLSGLLPWQFFSRALGESSNSLVGNSALITKVYFPRLLIPFATVAGGVVDFLVSLVLLAAAMVWYRFQPTIYLAAALLALPLAVMGAAGLAIWSAALNVKYRDFRYVMPFALQIGTYVSPVGFDSSILSPPLRALLSLNPIVCAIDVFRWAISGGRTTLYLPGLAISLGVSVILLVVGIAYFRNTERSFADVI
jgi:lipopolysaccharide transport system permease protein